MPGSAINRYPLSIDGQSVQIGNASELAIALDVLQGQFDRETLEQLRPHLAEIVANAAGFMTAMRSLATENQLFLIQAIGASLAGVIGSASKLRDILATLAEEQVEAALLQTLGSGGLRSLILDGGQLAEVLEWVYGAQDGLLLELLGIEYTRRLAKTAQDLGAILHNLDFALQKQLLETLGWDCVLGLVLDGRDLACLLRALPEENSAALLRHFSGARLKELIGNAAEWSYLYQRLEPAETELVLSLLKSNPSEE